ncbi:hypothetical protein BC628DRAFT_921466 [Trametes gibbosa]|nr:hypothetical protein BC628DRAFT_921466 [Trametes gibbosa]
MSASLVKTPLGVTDEFCGVLWQCRGKDEQEERESAFEETLGWFGWAGLRDRAPSPVPGSVGIERGALLAAIVLAHERSKRDAWRAQDGTGGGRQAAGGFMQRRRLMPYETHVRLMDTTYSQSPSFPLPLVSPVHPLLGMEARQAGKVQTSLHAYLALSRRWIENGPVHSL